MLNRMLWTNNTFNVYHRNQFNASSNMKLVTSLRNFECQPCGKFEGLSYHGGYEITDPIIFAATVGSVNRIKKLVSSNFMVILSSVSVTFYTGATYSCSSKKWYFMKLEYKKFPRNLKGIAKGLEISRFLDCWIFCKKWKCKYDYAPGLETLCSWVTKGFAHNFPTTHSHIKRIQGYLHIPLSWWA